MTSKGSDLPLACVVLAAGKGTRMKSALPKVLHAVSGRAMLHHVLAVASELSPERTVTVIGKDMEGVDKAARAFAQEAGLPNASVAVQDPPLGTGHAVLAAAPALQGFEGAILVLYGDTPLLRPGTLKAMRAVLSGGADLVVLGFEPEEPAGYGRLILNPSGGLEAIVESKDATPEELTVRLCNSGVMLARSPLLLDLLAQVGNDNAKGEYYLTDAVALARRAGLACGVVRANPGEVMGVNSRADLAAAEAVSQSRLRRAALDGGVTMPAPETVFFSHDTRLAADVTVEPHVVFASGVTVAGGASIRAFSHLEKTSVAAGAVVGPYARVRPDNEDGVKRAKSGS